MRTNEKFEKLSLRIRLVITAVAVIMAVLSLLMVWAELSPDAEAADDDSVKLPVLMYHAIISDASKSGDYVITPEAFRRDMEYICSQGYETVVVADLIDYAANGTPLPEKPIMITLDDGYYNNYLYAYPVLSELGMRAVISVIGTETDRYTENHDTHEAYAHCSWEVLREMAASGVIEIQDHSYDLHHLDGQCMGIGRRSGEELAAYRTRLCSDLSHMRERCRTELGTAPAAFAYPFGCAPDDSASVIEQLGYRATLGVGDKTFYLSRDPDCLDYIPRYNRPASKSAQEILECA